MSTVTLFDYMKRVQRFLRETKQDKIPPEDIIAYINQARREIAGRTQCVRRLTPISGSIESWAVTNGGSGYTAPTCVVTPPDFPSGTLPKPNGDQATAAAVISAGKIVAINSTYGGYGYFAPQITITDPTGSGATATPTLSSMNLLNPNQEVYSFSNIDLTQWPGVDSIFAIRSVAIIYANYRYVLPMYSFTEYQARIRQFPFQYQYVPTFCSQFGQGGDGSVYFYPLPSQTYQMEWDCLCYPSDLADNQSVDVIPHPWVESVAYYAAFLSYLGIQNMNAANFYKQLYEDNVVRRSQYARIGRAVNVYGRY